MVASKPRSGSSRHSLQVVECGDRVGHVRSRSAGSLTYTCNTIEMSVSSKQASSRREPMKLARIALIVMVGAATAHAQSKEAHDKEEAGEAAKNAPALAAALKDAKLSLADGLKAAEKSGRSEERRVGKECR